MSEAILKKLEKKIETSSETKDVLAYAKAYAEIEKADTDRMKIEAGIQSDTVRLQIERDKVTIDGEDRARKATLDQTKADVDAIVRKTQIENDKLKIDNDKIVQMAKIEASRADNKLMAGALGGGIMAMYFIEKGGILLSRNAGSLLKFVRFAKIV